MEFKGLKSQYLFIFAGGLLAVFVAFIVLFMAGVNQWLCIGFIVSASLLLVWQTFRHSAGTTAPMYSVSDMINSSRIGSMAGLVTWANCCRK